MKEKKEKALWLPHHDDPPCHERLAPGGYCAACGLTPDTQSKCLRAYCPYCEIKLKNLKCPNCEKSYAYWGEK